MRTMARHAISQRLYLQMIMYIVDYEYARYIMSLHTAGLCYKQPLTEPFLSRLYEIYLSIKDLDNLAEFNLLQNLHLCTQKFVCATNFGSLGEIGANFSQHLSSRTQFAKINYKKVIAENQCEKHKKSSLVNIILFYFILHLHFVNASLKRPRI